MEFAEKLNVLAQRISSLKDNVLTEEATKHSFIIKKYNKLISF